MPATPGHLPLGSVSTELWKRLDRRMVPGAMIGHGLKAMWRGQGIPGGGCSTSKSPVARANKVFHGRGGEGSLDSKCGADETGAAD